MPQQIRQTTAHDGHPLAVNNAYVPAAHAQIASILAARLGRAHAELLATPVQSGGTTNWTTPLTGEVLPASSLDDAARRALIQRAGRMLGDISGLAAQLASEGPATQIVAQMLERAARSPAGSWLYSVGGKPVLIMWGHSDAPEPTAMVAAASAAPMAMPAAVPSVSPSAETLAAEGASAPYVAAPIATPVATPPAPRTWLRWLLAGLLALILLAMLFWGWKSCTPAAQAQDLTAEIAQAEERNRQLEDQIRQRRSQPNQYQCVPDAPQPAASAPAPIASEPAPAASEPASAPTPTPAPDPYSDLKRKVDASPKDCNALQAMLRNEPLLKADDSRSAPLRQQVVKAMEANCKEKLISEAKNLCPGARPKELAPELVIVFDASKSMDFGITVTEGQIDQAMNLERSAVGIFGQEMVRKMTEPFYREPKRITTAKEAVLSIGRRVPKDMNIGLVLVDECPAARTQGYFPPAQRSALLSRLQAIQPVGGTPLADGVRKAGQMLDGVNRESLMLVVSDGRESCNGDPCGVAAALARAKPHLRINVVDITGAGAGNCLASATHGKVFTARNAEEVAATMKQAAAEAMAPANCKAN